MCIASSPKRIAAPIVAPAPTREQSAVAAVESTKTLIAKRQGVFGNIRTTPLGDANYGSSVVARFGKAA